MSMVQGSPGQGLNIGVVLSVEKLAVHTSVIYSIVWMFMLFLV